MNIIIEDKVAHIDSSQIEYTDFHTHSQNKLNNSPI